METSDKVALAWEIVRDFPENPNPGDPVVRLSQAQAENGKPYYSASMGRLGKNGRVMPYFPIFTAVRLGTVSFTDDLPNVFRDLLTESREYVRMKLQAAVNDQAERRVEVDREADTKTNLRALPSTGTPVTANGKKAKK